MSLSRVHAHRSRFFTFWLQTDAWRTELSWSRSFRSGSFPGRSALRWFVHGQVQIVCLHRKLVVGSKVILLSRGAVSLVWSGLQALKDARTFGLNMGTRDRPRSVEGANMNFDLISKLFFKAEKVGKQVFQRAPVEVLEEEVQCFQGSHAVSSEQKVHIIWGQQL